MRAHGPHTCAQTHTPCMFGEGDFVFLSLQLFQNHHSKLGILVLPDCPKGDCIRKIMRMCNVRAGVHLHPWDQRRPWAQGRIHRLLPG